MEKDYEVISIADTDRLDAGGGITTLVDVQFRVGKFGPFRVKVPKDASWETAMRTAIDAEVRRVKAITS